MARVTAFEAKTRFGELLERVAAGEEIVITRHDKPVARVVPEGIAAHADVRAAVDGLKRLRDDIAGRPAARRRLTSKEVRAAIDEGRS